MKAQIAYENIASASIEVSGVVEVTATRGAKASGDTKITSSPSKDYILDEGSEKAVELLKSLWTGKNLLAPAFNKKIVQVVWDEHKATVTIVKDEKRKLKAYGSLSAYADISKIATEKEAWPEAAVMKHGK